MTEQERQDVKSLILLFRWDDSLDSHFHALVQLRKARQEIPPTWDDWIAGVDR